MKGWGRKRKAGANFLNGRRSKASAPASTPGPAHAEAREPDSAPPTNTSELREAPSEGISWRYHSSQIDENNKFQRLSSAVVRQNFQELLLGDRDVYREHFSIVSRMNPAIAAAVHDHTVSKANMHRYERARSLFGYNDDRTRPTRRRRRPRSVRRASPSLGESPAATLAGRRTTLAVPSSSCR